MQRTSTEGEFVAVIGKSARRRNPDQAADCIMGWTIGDDVSEGDWQAKDFANLRGKNSDTFKPMDPRSSPASISAT